MKAARLYAQVLVDTAGTVAVLESAKSDLKKFGDLFIESPLLANVLSSPTISEDEKQKVVSSFSEKISLSPLSQKFLSILILSISLQTI